MGTCASSQTQTMTIVTPRYRWRVNRQAMKKGRRQAQLWQRRQKARARRRRRELERSNSAPLYVPKSQDPQSCSGYASTTLGRNSTSSPNPSTSSSPSTSSNPSTSTSASSTSASSINTNAPKRLQKWRQLRVRVHKKRKTIIKTIPKPVTYKTFAWPDTQSGKSPNKLQKVKTCNTCGRQFKNPDNTRAHYFCGDGQNGLFLDVY